MQYTEKLRDDLKLATFIMNIVKPETENYRVITAKLVKYDTRISEEHKEFIIKAIERQNIRR